MLRKKLLGYSVGLGILFGATTAIAQMPTELTQQPFQRIDQPAELKIGVTIVGFGLIGLELWWFLNSKAQKAETTKADQRDK